MRLHASSSRDIRGQLKIQEMAFVLVAICVFFGIAALFFVTVNLGSVKQDVQDLNRENARQIVYQIASTPEFRWRDEGCSGCIDELKILLVKEERGIYLPFWNIDYLAIESVYPKNNEECTLSNYPNCGRITLANNSKYFGTPSTAFVSICRDEKIESGGSYEKCELGRIYASVEGLE